MSVDGVHLLHCKPRFSFSLVKGTDNCFSRGPSHGGFWSVRSTSEKYGMERYFLRNVKGLCRTAATSDPRTTGWQPLV